MSGLFLSKIDELEIVCNDSEVDLVLHYRVLVTYSDIPDSGVSQAYELPNCSIFIPVQLLSLGSLNELTQDISDPL